MRWTTWLWARLLVLADELLGTHLVEREMARHQAKIDRVAAQLKSVNQDLDGLLEGLGFCRLALCLVELEARSERDDLDDWLCFEFNSMQAGDESVLDSAIECLVKPRLATIDEMQIDSGDYVYHLHPDWRAIVACLRETPVAPELMAWLEEQL